MRGNSCSLAYRKFLTPEFIPHKSAIASSSNVCRDDVFSHKKCDVRVKRDGAHLADGRYGKRILPHGLLNIEDFFFLDFRRVSEALHVTVGQLLRFFLALAVFVFGNLLVLRETLDVLVAVAANVTY